MAVRFNENATKQMEEFIESHTLVILEQRLYYKDWKNLRDYFDKRKRQQDSLGAAICSRMASVDANMPTTSGPWRMDTIEGSQVILLIYALFCIKFEGQFHAHLTKW